MHLPRSGGAAFAVDENPHGEKPVLRPLLPTIVVLELRLATIKLHA